MKSNNRNALRFGIFFTIIQIWQIWAAIGCRLLPPDLFAAIASGDEIAAPAAKGRSLVDRNGHDESWWKGKIRKWVAKREAATLKLGETEVALAGLKSKNLPPAMEQAETDRLTKEANQYRKEAVEANEMLESILPEEARKAGAPPGWLQDTPGRAEINSEANRE